MLSDAARARLEFVVTLAAMTLLRPFREISGSNRCDDSTCSEFQIEKVRSSFSTLHLSGPEITGWKIRISSAGEFDRTKRFPETYSQNTN